MKYENFDLFEQLIQCKAKTVLPLILDEYKEKYINEKVLYRLERKLKAKTFTESDAMFCLSELINAGYCVNYISEETQNIRRDLGIFLPLNYSILYNLPIFIEFFLSKKANINEQDRHGATPIFLAQTAEVAEFLIKNGADLEHRDKFGRNVEEFLAFMRQETDLFKGTPALNFILDYKKKQLANQAPVDLPKYERRTF